MTPEERAEADPLIENHLCSKWALSHSAGPMYWLRNCTKTYNFHWQQQGLLPEEPFPFKPFTDRRINVSELPFEHDFGKGSPCRMCEQYGFKHCAPDYLDIVMGFMLFADTLGKANELLIPKTRTMLTSWSAVGRITWQCQFYPQVEWIGQSETDEKALGNVRYANALYSNQSEWMKKLHPLKTGEEGTLHKIEWANGSVFRNVSSGVRKLASSHPYGYFNDETAHQPAAEATINIARPACKQIIAVSSVAPGWFWNEVSQSV